MRVISVRGLVRIDETDITAVDRAGAGSPHEGEYTMRVGAFAGSILFALLAVGCSTQQAITPTRTTPKPLLVDEYAVLDDAVTAPALNDLAIQKRMDAARAHYLHALKQAEIGRQKEAAKHFEASIAILNEMMTHPEINALPEYTRLSRSVIRDYEGKITSIDDLDSNSSFFVLREKMFQEIELLPVSFQPATTTEEVLADFDTLVIDLPDNEAVQQTIDYFTIGRGRKYMALWLERSGRYFPLYERILAEEGAPDELKYLSMIESGLDARATSHAAAVGLWQFIGSTGRAYGMHADWYRDERRDPEKATRAAARYLLDLYDQMGDWHLALGSYNCGPGRMRRALRSADTADYWEARKHLPKETARYVPLYVAAAKIARDPAAYGFTDIKLQDPFEYDLVPVYAPYQLTTIAEVAGCSVEDLRDLNPELLQSQVPPGEAMYDLRVPAGLGSYVSRILDTLTVDGSSSMSWINHKVQSGETVTRIAKRYGVSVSAVLDANDMTAGSTLYRGSSLKIPVQGKSEPITAEDIAEAKRRAAAEKAEEDRQVAAARARETGKEAPVTSHVAVAAGQTAPTKEKSASKDADIDRLIAEVPTAERKRDQPADLPQPVPVDPEESGESTEAVFVSVDQASIEEAEIVGNETELEVTSSVEKEGSSRPGSAAPPLNEVAATESREKEIEEPVTSAVRTPTPIAVASDAPTTGPRARVGDLADAESLAQIRRYKVRRGETLNDIAAKFNVSVRELQESNPRLGPNGLLPGQVIRIR